MTILYYASNASLILFQPFWVQVHDFFVLDLSSRSRRVLEGLIPGECYLGLLNAFGMYVAAAFERRAEICVYVKMITYFFSLLQFLYKKMHFLFCRQLFWFFLVIFVNMSDVDEEEFMCGDDEEYDLVSCRFTSAYILLVRCVCSVNRQCYLMTHRVDLKTIIVMTHSPVFQRLFLAPVSGARNRRWKTGARNYDTLRRQI